MTDKRHGDPEHGGLRCVGLGHPELCAGVRSRAPLVSPQRRAGRHRRQDTAQPVAPSACLPCSSGEKAAITRQVKAGEEVHLKSHPEHQAAAKQYAKEVRAEGGEAWRSQAACPTGQPSASPQPLTRPLPAPRAPGGEPGGD